MHDKETKYYCTHGWNQLHVMDNGDAYPCCPSWIDYNKLGNLKTQSTEEVWNGKQAQDFRASILDGSFKYCNADSCQHMRAKTMPVLPLDAIQKCAPAIADDIRNNKTVIDHGPIEIEFTYDRSCNLSCPSCRRKVIIVAGKKKEEQLELQEKIKASYFKDAETFAITAAGDAFASPIFRKLLQNLKEEDAPNLRDLRLMTNGILLPRYWDTLSDYAKSRNIMVGISVDAASEEVYAVNRRGGTWEGIQKALKYTGELRKSDQIDHFSISFVTQKNNFRQIKDFCEMGIEVGVDYFQFQIMEPDFLRDLYPTSYFEEWAEKAVQEKTHPDHQELVKILQDDYFSQFPTDTNERTKGDLPVLALGQLLSIRNGIDISQYDNNYQESIRVQQQADKEQEQKAIDIKQKAIDIKQKAIDLEYARNMKMVEKGLLKDVWFKDESHFIQLKFVKKINNTDVVQLKNGEVLKWDGDSDVWISCSKESLEYKEYSLQ